MKFLGFLLVQKFILCASKASEEIIKSEQSVDLSNDETLILTSNVNNDYMYLYKTNIPSENYQNYRAVYGLRYRPTRKVFKSETNNYNIIAEKSKNNDSISFKEVIRANNTETGNASEEYESSSFESEILSQSETPPDSESSLKLPTTNVSSQSVELVVDDSRNHIMRPNNRVEHALDFLAARLKKLIYYSADKTRPESKLSTHLSSLGKFLNLFSLIKFENIPCITAHKPLRQLSGTCYNEVQCFNLGGIAVDRCAHGLGVCCVCELSRNCDKKFFLLF